MIRLSDLLDATRLARAVHTLARERDALATLAGQLEGEVGELDRSLGMALATIQTMGGELAREMATAEALRHELAERTTPGDVRETDKPFPMPGTVWMWRGAAPATGPTGPHTAEALRWFRGRVEALFADSDSCADVGDMMGLDAWEVVAPARDAASPEAEVLRLAYQARDTWSTDVGAPALRRQLQAAEVELAAARAEVATVRADRREVRDLLGAEGFACPDDGRTVSWVMSLVRQRNDERRRAEHAEAGWSKWSHEAGLAGGRAAEALDRAGRHSRHAFTLARRLRAFVALHGPAVSRLILHAAAPRPTCGAVARSPLLAGMVCTLERHTDDVHETWSPHGGLIAGWVDDADPPSSTQDQPPPTQPSERAVRVAVSS